jgi:hypothetical protein
MREIPPPVFSRRSFIFFILLAPACILAVAGIVLTLQYKQFQTLVAASSTVEAPSDDPASRLKADSLLALVAAFSAQEGPDTLRLSPGDLNLLAAASPVLKLEEIRFHFSDTVKAGDSLLVVTSSRRLEALNGRFAWIFKRIAPIQNGWLNATMEGYPEWKSGVLSFAPERGYMNGAKVPKAAMVKRGGMSPKDFLDTSAAPAYRALLGAIDTVLWNGRAVALVRQTTTP